MVACPAPEPSEAARLAALADRCVQCGLCLPHCPTYRLDTLESESPRGRIAYIRALARDDLAPTEVGDTHLDHCLGCRRCEAACPAGVTYGALLVGARAAQAARRPIPLPQRWRLALLARPRLLQRLLRGYRTAYAALPRPWRRLPRPPPPADVRPVAAPAAAPQAAVFVGCIASGYESSTRAALTRLLAATGVQARTPAGQTCCGAAHAHAGDAAGAARLAADNRAAFTTAPPVLCLASGCLETLRASLAGSAVVDDALTFLADRAGTLRFRSAAGRRVALHLPCTQRVERTEQVLRELLARVPELDLVELPDTGCCGAAGLHASREPRRAARLRAPLLEALSASGARELLSANIGCRLHLADDARMPVRHPIDFLAEHLA